MSDSCTCGSAKFGWPHAEDCPLRTKQDAFVHRWGTFDIVRQSTTCDLCGYEYTMKAKSNPNDYVPPCTGKKRSS